MGLDAVELVIAFEEECGVRIADAEIAQMATPGDVAHSLPSRLHQRKSDACPSQRQGCQALGSWEVAPRDQLPKIPKPGTQGDHRPSCLIIPSSPEMLRKRARHCM